MRAYPLIFAPIYKEKVWGGRRLQDICGRDLPPGKRIGESWEVADHGDDVSRVANGPWEGAALSELVRERPEAILGRAVASRRAERFPLLLKLIDACENLSVQVHPPDRYAAAHEGGERGKTELWYIVHAEAGAALWCGFERGADRESLGRALVEGRVTDLLRRIAVRAGDAVFVPAGRVHSIGAGLLVLEIEESSDLTYRLYDWNRPAAGRPMHRGKAMEVIDFADSAHPLVAKAWHAHGEYRTAALVRCRHFRTDEIEVLGRWESACAGDRFRLLSVARGEGGLEYDGGRKALPLRAGDTVLLPAALGSYAVRARGGGCAVLQTEVP